MFGKLHPFIDTGIYFHDEEMRKQAETLVHKAVVTAQEAVEGCGHAMREDLYKKHMSADPIACRLPYAIVTKMVELIGWKRFELNKLVKFVGCDETNWWSIMRRSLVVQFNGRFVNAQRIAKLGGAAAAASYGVFLMDNNLKTFLQGSAAAACLFKLVRGAMAKVSSDDMQQFLDDYVNELDDHFTFKKYGKRATPIPVKFFREHRPNRSGSNVFRTVGTTVAQLHLSHVFKMIRRLLTHRMQ